MPGLEDTLVEPSRVAVDGLTCLDTTGLSSSGLKKNSRKGVKVPASTPKREMAFVGSSSVPQSVWEYEERTTTLEPTAMLLVRVVIAKVKSLPRLWAVFESTPLRLDIPGWN